MPEENFGTELPMKATHDGKPLVYGTTPHEVVRTLTGLQFMQGLVEGRFPAPTIMQALDFRLVEVGPGLAVFEGTPDGRFFNPLGSIHGGYAATLLDSCMGCAAHTTVAAGQGFTTLEVKVNYVRAMSEKTGLVRAEGRVINAGRTVVTAEGRIVDAAGKLYAHGTTTCLILAL
jgi:uncharacterized protein (TIGR00369 family)